MFAGMGRGEQYQHVPVGRQRGSVCLGQKFHTFLREENVPLVAWVENACIPMVGGNGLGRRLAMGAACKLIFEAPCV